MKHDQEVKKEPTAFISGAFLAIAVGLVAGCGSCPTLVPAVVDGSTATLAIINGTLIDGTGSAPLPEAVLLIAGERILVVGSRETLSVPAGVPTIDVAGAVILPGFINAHVHEGYSQDNLRSWAMAGVTTVRDEAVLSDQTLSEVIAFRDEARRDPQFARLVSAGYMISVPGGYGSLFVTSLDDAREKVLEELEAGVEVVKVALEDGYAGRHDLPNLTTEELASIVQTAHEQGSLVSGHITQSAYLRPMLEAGVDDIAHVPYDPVPEEVLRDMVERGIYLVPTFTVFRNFSAPVEGCVENLRGFVAQGGMVALGNDYGGGPGEFELGIPMYEIEMMSTAGMTPMQIIVAGTKHAAHVSGLEDELGTLEAGKIADILVVEGDPLADLQVLLEVRMVIHEGVIIRDEIR